MNASFLLSAIARGRSTSTCIILWFRGPNIFISGLESFHKVNIQPFARVERTGLDRNGTLTAGPSAILNSITSKCVVRNHAYDAGIIFSTERHDPRGGPGPTHWTFEGLYRTIDMASLPFSPTKARQSQLHLISTACIRDIEAHSLLSNYSAVQLTYVFSNPASVQVVLDT